MDRLTKEQRYKNMSANKGKGTKLELLFGKLLWNAGVRYRKNDKRVLGRPDFVIRKMRIAIFCDGEFCLAEIGKNAKTTIKAIVIFGIPRLSGTLGETKK